MTKNNWLEILGWGTEQLQDLEHAGYSYIKQGKYDTAQTFFEALVILDPQNAYDWETLGAVLLQRGDAVKALDCLNKGLQLNSKSPLTRLNKINALLALGKRKEAIEAAKVLAQEDKSEVGRKASALVMAYS